MKKLIFAVIAGATMISAAQAQTQVPGPYIGVGVATADHVSNIGGTTGSSSDGYKASGKLFGGYDFDQTWGVEAGYTDFRKSHYNYSVNNVPGNASSDGHSFYVAGKATMPLNEQFSVFGKLGAAQNKNNLNASTIGLSRSDSKTEAYGALGAQYSLTKQVALTLEYERYGKSKDFGAKADVWTVGAKYSF
jgi:OOP family OmpA-OmpF porin